LLFRFQKKHILNRLSAPIIYQVSFIAAMEALRHPKRFLFSNNLNQLDGLPQRLKPVLPLESQR